MGPAERSSHKGGEPSFAKSLEQARALEAELFSQTQADSSESGAPLKSDPDSAMAVFNRTNPEIPAPAESLPDEFKFLNNPEQQSARPVTTEVLTAPESGHEYKVSVVEALSGHENEEYVYFPQFGVPNEGDKTQELKIDLMAQLYPGRLYFIDKPGTGGSNRLDRSSRKQIAAGEYKGLLTDIMSSLDQRNLQYEHPEEVRRTFAGYSEGALYAAHAAAVNPTNVAEIHLMEPVGLDDSDGDKFIPKAFLASFVAEGERFSEYRESPNGPRWVEAIGENKHGFRAQIEGAKEVGGKIMRSPRGMIASVRGMAKPSVAEALAQAMTVNPDIKLSMLRGGYSRVSPRAAHMALKQFLHQAGVAAGHEAGFRYREMVMSGDPHGGATENIYRLVPYLRQLFRR